MRDPEQSASIDIPFHRLADAANAVRDGYVRFDEAVRNAATIGRILLGVVADVARELSAGSSVSRMPLNRRQRLASKRSRKR